MIYFFPVILTCLFVGYITNKDLIFSSKTCVFRGTRMIRLLWNGFVLLSLVPFTDACGGLTPIDVTLDGTSCGTTVRDDLYGVYVTDCNGDTGWSTRDDTSSTKIKYAFDGSVSTQWRGDRQSDHLLGMIIPEPR